MTRGDYRINCAEANAADWLSLATLKLDEISRSIEATVPVEEAVCLRRAEQRVLADREVIRGHVQSLRCRLSSVTRDPSVAVYLQAELSQLEWTARHCVRQMRNAFPDLGIRIAEVRAS
ncbi:MAG: hypothetical protein PSX37_05710 [bacterium]|nr:hypothetical protein [bacterium]